jgi:hypothetical protein
VRLPERNLEEDQQKFNKNHAINLLYVKDLEEVIKGVWIVARNLNASIGRKELYDHFGEFGRILSCKVKLIKTGQSTDYGFVHYESEKAQAAIEKVNNTTIAGKEVYAFLFSYCFDYFALYWFFGLCFCQLFRFIRWSYSVVTLVCTKHELTLSVNLKALNKVRKERFAEGAVPFCFRYFRFVLSFSCFSILFKIIFLLF